MTQQEYEQKRRECWEEYKKQNLDGEVQWQPVSRYDVFCAAFDRAYALGKQEKELEPTEPTCTQTCTDDCQSLCTSQEHIPDPTKMTEHIADPDKMVDGIIKDGFNNHNRLHIAAMAMAGLLANTEVTSGFMDLGDPEHPAYIARRAFGYADALLKECRDKPNPPHSITT